MALTPLALGTATTAVLVIVAIRETRSIAQGTGEQGAQPQPHRQDALPRFRGWQRLIAVEQGISVSHHGILGWGTTVY
jgi:hypothetical protein